VASVWGMSKPTPKVRRKKRKQPVLYVRVKRHEHQVIEQAAEHAGMTIAAWARFVLAQQAYAVVPKDLRRKPKTEPTRYAHKRVA
jgi:hypothetical protein